MYNFKVIFDHKLSKILLYTCAIRFPKHNALLFPFYTFLIYVQIYYKNKRFLIKCIPRELMKQLLIQSKDISTTDMNNTVIVNSSILKMTKIKNLAKLQINSDGKPRVRVVYVIGLNIPTNQLLLSDALYFNLKINQDCTNITAKIKEISAKPQCASYVNISLINSNHDVINAVTDELLKNYFNTPKIIQRDDLIQIKVKDFCPKYYYTHNQINEIDLIYFKCNKIKQDDNFDCKSCYMCCSDESTLKQSANTQSFLVPIVKEMKCVNDIEYKIAINVNDYLVNTCPTGLEMYLKEIEDCIKPFLQERCQHLKPTFLIKGPRGVGKDILIKSFTKKFGINLYKINPIEIQSQTYAQTELKIRNFMLKAKLCTPCVLLINNFENFGENNEGQYDLRIVNCFKSELENLFSNNNYPVVLICSSNKQDIPSDLSRLFLETIEIKSPNISDRCELLKWILNQNNINYKLNLNDIANKTNGFLFEDLKALVYYAHKIVIEENLCDNLIELKQFEGALDVMQAKYSDTLGVPKVPKIEWSDVGALNDVKHEIIRTIDLPLKHPDLLKATGLKRSGILLYGPPGTGKTLLAKAVATECGLCFLSVKGPELLNMYVGQSEQNVREVFEKARQASPCIVFFDELDSLAPNRGMSGDSGGVMDRVVSQLLAEMDGLNQTGIIFIIGATNRPDLIDPALLRPGRFDKLLYVGPCVDYESKLAVIKAVTRKFKFAKDVNFEEIVKGCPSTVTGADFYGICSSAWMFAAKELIKNIETGKIKNWESLTNEDVIVNKNNFIEAVKSIKPSVSAEDLLYFNKLKNQLNSQ